MTFLLLYAQYLVVLEKEMHENYIDIDETEPFLSWAIQINENEKTLPNEIKFKVIEDNR